MASSSEDEGTLAHEQVAALASNPQVVGVLQGLAMMMAAAKVEESLYCSGPEAFGLDKKKHLSVRFRIG